MTKGCNMKKCLSILLAAGVMFSMASCNGGDGLCFLLVDGSARL